MISAAITELQDIIQLKRNNLSTNRLDMSFGEIISMYLSDEIVISPDFQRLFRWSEYQKTRFLESILIGIPIPPIFVAEDENGKWELVDGLQRLSTVLSFFGILKGMPEKNNWTLQKGEIVPELAGYSIENLPLKLQLNIKRATCRVEIISWNSKFDMRFELFNRLNTGGAMLTDQEIRNAIFRGISTEFNVFLKKWASNNDFLDLIKPSHAQKEQLYPEELVLRFCSLIDFEGSITENMSLHMTNYMRDAVKYPEKIAYLDNLLGQIIEMIKPIGMGLFRSKPTVSFSTGLFDCIMVGLAKNIKFYQSKGIDEIKARKQLLLADPVYKKASGSGSNSKSRLEKRVEIAKRIFNPALSK